MKNKVFILTLLLAGHFHSQTIDWAPVGAKWYYQETYFMSDKINYVMIESVKDTVVNNHLCKKLVLSKSTYQLVAPLNLDTIFYTYKENDTIFLYDNASNVFRPIFVNNLQVGDSLKISWNIQNYGICNYAYKVDSINYININSMSIKKIVLKDETGNRFQFLENIGGIGYNIFTPLILKYNCIQMVIDGTFYKFRCYYHPQYGLFKLSNEACDYVYTGIEEYNPKDEFIYSFNKTLYFKETNRFLFDLKIISIDGRILYEIHKQDLNPVEFTNISQGIYLVEIVYKNKTYRRKIIFN